MTMQNLLQQCRKKSHSKVRRFWVVLAAVALLLVLACRGYDWDALGRYKGDNISSLHYVRGRVVEVLRDDTKPDQLDPARSMGTQELRILLLALLAALFAWVLGLGTGIIAAIRQNSLVDHLFMGVSLAGVSMPIFMVALLLQYLFAFKIKAFPLTLDGTFLSMILPAIALGWNSAGSIARMTRSSLLEVMQADYIDTARAKGLRKQAVILGHALKNSMLPVITMMALQFSGMLSGAVITESIFAIPGIGRLATTAIQNRDMPVLQGTVLFTTVLVIAGNLIADLLYSVLDPRIRKEA